jgi:hypothetical protein
MSIIKIAFVHYRHLGPKEADHYATEHENYAKKLHSPTSKTLYRGLGGVIGGVGGGVIGGSVGNSKSAAALGALIGVGAGAGLGELSRGADERMVSSKAALMRGGRHKWIVFGKGQSHLDNG